MKVWIALLATVPAWLLSGCDDAAPLAQAPTVAGKQNAPAMAQGAQPPAVPAAVGTLFDHVKRLNAACVAAGGGVSGSPDCDAALAREQELEGLGYCIDYPNDEALVRCPASHSAAKEQKAKP